MPTSRIAGVVALFCLAVFSQQPPPMAFEAAVIKPSQDPPGSPSGIAESWGRIVAKHVTLKRCVRGAYNVAEAHVLGGPGWADLDRYHIEAKAASRVGSRELMLMLQTLLAERFKLVLHRELRMVSGYRLVLAKGGLKAPASAPDGASVGRSTRSRIDCEGCTMTQFSVKLSEVLHWPVVDMTGVAGKFDVKVDWKSEGADANPVDYSTSIFAALQEQAGLRMESGKVSAEVLVIDSAEKPSEN
jgi:uncharacterized protein (TIGR03435 family)